MPDLHLQHILMTLATMLNAMSPYVLLGFLIAGLLNEFVPAGTMARHLSGRGMLPVVKAAMIGVPLPLCSCGVLPAAVGMHRRGASAGATTSFLIATPQTGVDSIAATYSMLGLPFAIIRPVAALLGSIAGGVAVSATENSGAPASACNNACPPSRETTEKRPGVLRRLLMALRYGMVDMVSNMGKWLILGLVVAALITVFVPENVILAVASNRLLAMVLMVIIAVPMYVCATGSIPIAMSLMLKGLAPGAAFVLLMAGPAANFASVLVLKREMGTKVTMVYIGTVVLTAIAIGCVIDFLLPASWFIAPKAVMEHGAHGGFPWFSTLCSAILVAALIYALLIKPRIDKNIIKEMDNSNTLNQCVFAVTGMNCNHCRASVEKAISGVPGVEHVEVSLAEARATVTGTPSVPQVIDAVREAGFECKEIKS